MIVDAILLVVALLTRFRMKEVPGGLQNFMEWIVETLYGLAESVAGKNAAKFFPYAVTIFLLIILSNWIGPDPGRGQHWLLPTPVGPTRKSQPPADDRHADGLPLGWPIGHGGRQPDPGRA